MVYKAVLQGKVNCAQFTVHYEVTKVLYHQGIGKVVFRFITKGLTLDTSIVSRVNIIDQIGFSYPTIDHALQCKYSTHLTHSAHPYNS